MRASVSDDSHDFFMKMVDKLFIALDMNFL